MPLDNEEPPYLADPDPPDGPPEQRAFAPDQLVKCAACLRVNPPTRAACLYCAAPLPLDEQNAALQKPLLRRLEKWEQGYNVVLAAGCAALQDAAVVLQTAELLRLKPEDLRRIVETGVTLPAACAASPEEASLIRDRLAALGVEALVIADGELGLTVSPPKRARGLELTEEALVLHPVGGGTGCALGWGEVSLLVAGRRFVRQVEVQERKGRRPETELVDARELSTDEGLLDIYPAHADGCWRIAAGSFDYSGLGPEKSLVTALNFSKLAEVLRGRASRASFDDSYHRVRNALAVAWPLEQQTESRGWHRGGPGRVTTEAVIRSDNEQQFTRYSRLRRQLRLRHPELKS
ncbi:MAG TPA: hypothetical protein VF723_00145 [Pyrinomonadaceae bacterium]